MEPEGYPYSARRPAKRIGRLVVVVVLLGLGIAWVVVAMRRGHFVADPNGVTMINSTRPSDGSRDVLVDTHVSASLNAGHAVDPHSLDGTTVQLYAAGDHKPVAAQVNTSASGADIVLTPTSPLQFSTRYIFEIKGAKDDQGADLLPFKMAFTTAREQPRSESPASRK